MSPGNGEHPQLVVLGARGTRHARATERAIETGLLACAALSVLTTIGIIVVLTEGSLAFFADVSPKQFLLDVEWTPLFDAPRYGIWPLLAGTLLTSSIALCVALPMGVLAALFLSELAPPRARRVLKPTLEILAGVPSLVYGAFALIVMTPMLQKVVPGLAGFNALSPGIVMGLMLTATVATLVDDGLRAVPRSLREGAWALGSDDTGMITRVLLPAARGSIAAAFALVAARAVGETMIVAIAAGQQPRLTADPRVPIETMTAFIMQVSMGDVPVGTPAYRSIFVVAGSLFVLTFALNWLAHRGVRGTS